MNSVDNSNAKHWFVLNYIKNSASATPQKHIDSFNQDGDRLELFAPIFRPATIVDGKVVFKEKLLTIYYVFVKGTLQDVKEICAMPNNGLSLVIDRSSDRRYAVISEPSMTSFKLIARLYANTIPFYNIEDIDLEEGDLVEIVDGNYAGLTGTFMPKSRSNKGHLVIAATASMGAVLWNIDAKYIRILKFAHDTRRQYDRLDSFIAKLYPTLRHFHAGQRLSEKEKSLLTVFSQRMGSVAIDNHKFDAKLSATLMCVHYMLGDMPHYRESATRYARHRHTLTNAWTIALVNLLQSVSHNDLHLLTETYQTISLTTGKLNRSQLSLLDEYRHYLNAGE